MRPAKAISCILSIVGVCALAPRTPAQTFASRHPIVIAASVVIDGKGWNVYAKGSNTPAETHKAAAASHEHEQNFIECIRSRKRPNADIEIGRISTTLCHLGNIACNLGREIHFDAEREDFGNDAVANARLRKTYRDKYPLPKV